MTRNHAHGQVVTDSSIAAQMPGSKIPPYSIHTQL